MNSGISIENVVKKFPGVLALDHVSLEFHQGEVCALVGENGAGKSTLMKILSGLDQADEGRVLLNGEPFMPRNPLDSIRHGISIINQELTPIPDMTVAENIFLRREFVSSHTRFVDRKKMNAVTAELFGKIGINTINPSSRMSSLSVSETQIVEIIKAVSNDSSFILMDEPTSALADHEVSKLFDLIHHLKKSGVGIIFISHKLDEIFQIAERIIVMRDGRVIETRPAAEFTRESLISAMVCREIKDLYPKIPAKRGEELLRVEGLGLEGCFGDVSFTLHRGEVLGFAGLMGAGRTEVAETIFGLRPQTAGEIYIRGRSVKIRKPKDAIRNGIALIPEDRKQVGLNLEASVRFNISIATLEKYIRGPFISRKKEQAAAEKQIKDLLIKTPSREQTVKNLSGGNQQKVVIGKWLQADADIIIMDEPTKGIDVGAKAEIYQLINRLVAGGKAVIMISSELPEVLGMSDRLLVLCEGRQRAILERNEFSQETVMYYATLAKVEEE